MENQHTQSQQPQLVPPPHYYHPPSQLSDDEINFSEIWGEICKGKWVIIAITVFFAFSAAMYAISLPNVYQAKALLAPADGDNNMSSMARQFGGLASLAGVNLGGGGDSKTTLAIEVMKSRQFISNFIEKFNLKVPLMAAKGWERESDTLLVNKELYDADNSKWIRDVEPPHLPEPSAWEAHEAFIDIYSISESKDSGMVWVSVEHYSPRIAKEWVDLLVKEINSVMKQKEVREAQNSIDFLSEQLNKTSVTEMQNVFYQLIEEQTKTIMLSEVREEYIFTTVDPAVEPEEKMKPRRAMIVLLGCVLGLLLGLSFYICKFLFSETDISDKQ
ncbi:Wzz/FepE/Etk N-terminal domain-containing protein [Corallincola platygyrae]|uniref:Wzz/FepE/Etk N-terminal domain-containing protein n=1 Tax=Corallincola platygyrae TaxID=1193278 RepID=A0ABW4XKH3_9GAMM